MKLPQLLFPTVPCVFLHVIPFYNHSLCPGRKRRIEILHRMVLYFPAEDCRCECIQKSACLLFAIPACPELLHIHHLSLSAPFTFLPDALSSFYKQGYLKINIFLYVSRRRAPLPPPCPGSITTVMPEVFSDVSEAGGIVD